MRAEFYGAAGSPRIKALTRVFPLGDGPLCKHGKVDSEGLNEKGGRGRGNDYAKENEQCYETKETA